MYLKVDIYDSWNQDHELTIELNIMISWLATT